jgi:hypothetical protein
MMARMAVRAAWQFLVLSVVLAGSQAAVVGRRPQSPPAPSRAAAVLTAEFLVSDGNGRPIVDLRPTEVAVTVDGRPKAVRGLHLLAKGPGAEAAALAWASRASGSPIQVHAEGTRTVLIAVDETSIPRGSEQAVQSVVAALVDLLGPSDLAALARLPGASAAKPEFQTGRDDLRAQLRRLAGRAAPVDYLARLRDQAPASFTDDEGPSQQQRLRDAARDTGASGASAPASAPPLDALARVIASWRNDPGAHTVVLVGTGLAAGPEAKTSFARCLEAAAVSRTPIYSVKPDGLAGPGEPALLAQLAQSSGGAALGVGRNPSSDLQRMVRDWSFAYAAELEDDGGDTARPLPLTVTVSRPGARVRAATTWSAQRQALPPVSAAPPAPAEAGGPARGAKRGGAQAVASAPADSPAGFTREPVTDGETQVAVARAVDYVAGYMRDLPNFVAEEDYDQSAERTQTGRYQNLDNSRRRTRSDFLMVTAPGVPGWMPFRDVFEVDGKKLHDREDRLRKLFLESGSSPEAMRDARVISDESSRYNLGTVSRTTNVPTLALAFLTRERVGGLNLRRGPEETIEGVRAWRIDFEEWRSPTLIRTTTKEDLPSSGTFWIDALTGRVMRTLLRTASGALRTEATVTYRRSESLGFWMPLEMREHYQNGNEEITAKATYTNYRRFQVNTEETIKD